MTFSVKKATPFTIKLVSKGDRWEDPLKHLNFSGAIHVTAIEAYGLKLTPNDVPVRIAGAAPGTKVESPANGGQLDFQPTLDMRREPYILSFKENVDLLKDVQVAQGLIDGLLAAIHPLFKDAYQFLQGTTIKVPIRGTSSNPRIDETAFQQATGDLMQQSLRKTPKKGAQDLLKNLFKK